MSTEYPARAIFVGKGRVRVCRALNPNTIELTIRAHIARMFHVSDRIHDLRQDFTCRNGVW